MTRTPDEIKKGLEYISIKDVARKLDAWEDGIPYDYVEDAAADALALIQKLQSDNAEKDQRIQQLEAEREEAKLTHRTEKCEAADYDCVELGRLRKELAQVKRERDDVARLEDDCPHCQHRDDAPVDCDLECLRCENPCICHKCRDGDKFEWRGVQKEDGNA